MAKIDDIQAGDYWLDDCGNPRFVTVVDGDTIFVSFLIGRSLELFQSRQIHSELLIRKIEKTEATDLFTEKIKEKIHEINRILGLDLKVTFTPEESATDKGGT